MRWIIGIRDWFLDVHAAKHLEEQFENVTGLPTYGASLKEAREFRLSEMTAHEWFSQGWR